MTHETHEISLERCGATLQNGNIAMPAKNYAGCGVATSVIRWETTVVTPSPRIVTP